MHQGVGDKVIEFGNYRWKVLETCEDRVLLLSESIIEKRPYHLKYQEIDWENCELRHYLNNVFYNQFSDLDKEKIITVVNENNRNPWYLTQGGNATEDRVFILDIYDVVCKYFGDSSSILFNRKNNDRYWFGKFDENNIKRLAEFNGSNYWWWLRTPGRNSKTATYIHGSPVGVVGINGNSVYFKNFGQERDGGVRPALWIRR